MVKAFAAKQLGSTVPEETRIPPILFEFSPTEDEDGAIVLSLLQLVCVCVCVSESKRTDLQ